MRRAVVLCLCTALSVVAAPKDDPLPAGAFKRLRVPTDGTITSLVFVSNDAVFVGTSVGWVTREFERRRPRQGGPIGESVFAAVRDGNRVWIGSKGKVYRIDPTASGGVQPTTAWESAPDPVTVLAVTTDGRRFLHGAGDRRIIFREGSEREVVNFELPGRALSGTLTANGRVFAVATYGGPVRVYSVSPGGAVELRWTKRVSRSDGVAAQFSPDGRLLAVSSAGRVHLLDSVTGRPLRALERKFGEGDVRAIAFSPDGRRIAVASAGPESVTRLWDTDSGDEVVSYRGHGGDTNAVAFSPDGRSLATAGADRSVLLWKVPRSPASARLPSATEAWEKLDSLDGRVAYRAHGALLADPAAAVRVIPTGFRGQADEPARIRRWVGDLDHDEFRIREAAARNLQRAGLRAGAVMRDPDRRRLGAEGEDRIRKILAAFDEHGIRVPESGLYGEPLRMARAIRVLETIGGRDARSVLVEMGGGPADDPTTAEATAALAALPGGR